MASTESENNDEYDTGKDRVPSVGEIGNTDNKNIETDTVLGKVEPVTSSMGDIDTSIPVREETNMEEREGDTKDFL